MADAQTDKPDIVQINLRLIDMTGQPREYIRAYLEQPDVKECVLNDQTVIPAFMCIAARTNDAAMIGAMLDIGVHPDLTEAGPRGGQTALGEALRKGSANAYRVLRQAGAKLETFNPASNIYDEPIEVLRKYVYEACKSGSFNHPFFEEALSDILHQGESFYSKDGEALIDQILESKFGAAMVGAMRCGYHWEEEGKKYWRANGNWNDEQLSMLNNHCTICSVAFDMFEEHGWFTDGQRDIEPLQALHNFASIGKLQEAMHPKHWQGEAKQAQRLELMAQLFPDEQALLLRELPSKLIDAAEIAGAQKPVKSWGAGMAV